MQARKGRKACEGVPDLEVQAVMHGERIWPGKDAQNQVPLGKERQIAPVDLNKALVQVNKARQERKALQDRKAHLERQDRQAE